MKTVVESIQGMTILYSVHFYKFTGTHKNTKSTHFQSAFGHKKDRPPIFQGISVVLPKLYLSGRRDRSRTGLGIKNSD